jgi:hypothetical protein
MRKCVFLLAAAIAILVAASDINGKWRAEFTSPDGTPRVNTFTFKVEGGKLTGTVAGSQDQTPIQNGAVSGEEISFSAERPFGTFRYKGRISGDEIKLKVEFNDQSFDITAKRVSN